MDESRGAPDRLPAVPGSGSPPAPGGRPSGEGRKPVAERIWRRLTRTRRGAAGVVIIAAALLLWPFSDWAVIPWLAGIATLVLLALLRVDRLLRGWVWHVGGLVVVGGLMWSTTPWAWALAGSIGVLIAGLIRLPAWRLAAVGAALCLLSGVAYGIVSYRTLEQQRVENAQAGEPLRQVVGEARPTVILPVMLQALSDDDADPICRLLNAEAMAELLEAVPAADCAAAVTEMHRRAGSTPPGDDEDLPQPVPTAATELEIDACDTAWATAAGQDIGRIVVGRTASELERYSVARFAPCSGTG